MKETVGARIHHEGCRPKINVLFAAATSVTWMDGLRKKGRTRNKRTRGPGWRGTIWEGFKIHTVMRGSHLFIDVGQKKHLVSTVSMGG